MRQILLKKRRLHAARIRLQRSFARDARFLSACAPRRDEWRCLSKMTARRRRHRGHRRRSSSSSYSSSATAAAVATQCAQTRARFYAIRARAPAHIETQKAAADLRFNFTGLDDAQRRRAAAAKPSDDEARAQRLHKRRSSRCSTAPPTASRVSRRKDSQSREAKLKMNRQPNEVKNAATRMQKLIRHEQAETLVHAKTKRDLSCCSLARRRRRRRSHPPPRNRTFTHTHTQKATRSLSKVTIVAAAAVAHRSLPIICSRLH